MNEDESPFICPLEHKDDDINITSSNTQNERTKDFPSSSAMASTYTLTKNTKLSSLTVFASSTMNEVTDDFYFDTVTLRAGFSNTVSLVSSSSGPTFSTSARPQLGTTTLSQSHSFRHSAKEVTPSVRETRSFMQKIQPSKTSQQRFLSSNAIKSAVTDDFYINTVTIGTHFGSTIRLVSLSSGPALSTLDRLHVITTRLSQSHSIRHSAKEVTPTERETHSFMQKIQPTKTSQQRFSSSNVIDSEVTDDFYFNSVTLGTYFTSTVSTVILLSGPALSISDGLQLSTTTLSQSYSFRHSAKELPSTMSQETHSFIEKIQATKTSQQRFLSSNAIESAVTNDFYYNTVTLGTHFSRTTSMAILSSGPAFSTLDDLHLSTTTSESDSFRHSAKEVIPTGSRETHMFTQKIQPTKISQQRFLSSNTIGSKGK